MEKDHQSCDASCPRVSIFQSDLISWQRGSGACEKKSLLSWEVLFGSSQLYPTFSPFFPHFGVIFFLIACEMAQESVFWKGGRRGGLDKLTHNAA